MKTIEERFWAKIDKNGPNGCWMWKGTLDKDSYGMFGRDSLKAHRITYEWLLGPIHVGLEIDHLCRIPGCVNPNHLEAVPHRINVLRGNNRAAQNAKRTHCIRGHPFDLFNTRFRQTGGRGCKACQAIGQKERRDTVPIKDWPGLKGKP